MRYAHEAFRQMIQAAGLEERGKLRPRRPYWLPKVLLAGLILAGISLLDGLSLPRAAAQGQLSSPYATQAVPTSILQVTGTADRFTVIADRADVRSLLFLVFGQAEKNFTLENNVTGQVTMRLSGQSFPTLLEAVCKQTFLRYRQDPATGIYTFARDDAAVAAAFSQLRALNSQLAQQLRGLGLDLPYQTNGYGVPITQNGGFGGGGFAGGFGGRALQGNLAYRSVQNNTTNAPAGTPAMQTPMGPAGPQGPPGPQGDMAASRLDKLGPQREPIERGATKTGKPGVAGERGRGGADQAAAGSATNRNLNLQAQNFGYNPAEVDAVQQLSANNNYVQLYVPKDRTIPVRDALEQLAQQANVTLLIDPHVPAGPKFRLNGSIPARTLPEALNLLAPTARLDWKWVGDTIYVTTAPDFQIFWGDSNVPRAAYPPMPPAQQNAVNQKAAATAPANSKAKK